MPVLPLVASMIVIPGFNSPRRSPALIIASAGRSFTEPPGFRCSALAYRATPGGKSQATLRRRINGVFPMLAAIESCESGESRQGDGASRTVAMFSLSDCVKSKAGRGSLRSRPAFENLLRLAAKSDDSYARGSFPDRDLNNRRNRRNSSSNNRRKSSCYLSVNIGNAPTGCQAPRPRSPQKSNLIASCTCRGVMIERGKPNAAAGNARVRFKVLVAATGVKVLYWFTFTNEK